jgi:DNA-binding transcriptional MocR family regulator
MAVPERALEASADGRVDLSRNEPAHCPLAADALRRTLEDIARDAPLAEFLTYQPTGGMRRHREAGARWLSGLGVDVPADDILMTAGGQHALTVALMAVCRSGNLVLTEDLTYPGLRGLAALLGIRLQGLAMDEHGIRPDAFEAACRGGGARLLYLMPTLQNPTASTMPMQRRAEIVAIAADHDVLLLEDDVYGVLMGDSLPPVAALAPASTFYLTGLKVLGPGLRIGILRVPPSHMAAAQAALRATMWMAPPLIGEVAARWIEDGTATSLAGWHKAEASARAGLLSSILGNESCRSGGYHAWLRLPDPWRSADFAARAAAEGVSILPSDHFAIGRQQDQEAVRLCIGCPPDRETLAAGLRRLASLVKGKPLLDVASG